MRKESCLYCKAVKSVINWSFSYITSFNPWENLIFVLKVNIFRLNKLVQAS